MSRYRPGGSRPLGAGFRLASIKTYNQLRTTIRRRVAPKKNLAESSLAATPPVRRPFAKLGGWEGRSAFAYESCYRRTNPRSNATNTHGIEQSPNLI
jgi:hypothetical protein